MKTRSLLTIAAIAVVLAVVGTAKSAQDKYTLRVPNGLAFSEFKGYENWQVVSVSQTADLLKVMVANPTMIEAYRSGIPGNGKLFPDGSKIAKIEWKPKRMAEAPFLANVPDTLQDVFLIEKDGKRFPDTKGWAYAVLTMSPRPTRSSRIRPAPSIADSRAIRPSRARTTSFTRIRSGDEEQRHAQSALPALRLHTEVGMA